MGNLINPDLIRWISCPLCDGDLIDSIEWLKCTRCDTKYEVRQGIPLLYPPSMSIDHLLEEEKLAGMRKSPNSSSKGKFSAL